MPYAKLPSFLLALSFTVASAALHADEPITELSYGKTTSLPQLTQTVNGLNAWAENELAEHETEGLFKSRADEQAIIRQTIALAQQALAQARHAEKQGDSVTARANYYAAEAIANYAAHMPHLLEDRLATNN